MKSFGVTGTVIGVIVSVLGISSAANGVAFAVDKPQLALASDTNDTMQQLRIALEIGRTLGIDSEAVLRIAGAIQKTLPELGIGEAASLTISVHILGLIADGRAAGVPYDGGQAGLVVLENMELATKNTQVGAAAVLMDLADRGTIDKNDPAVAKILADIEAGKEVSPSEIYSTIERLTGNADKYMSQNFKLISIAAQAERVLKYINEGPISLTQTTKGQLKYKGLDADGGQLDQLYKKLKVQDKHNEFPSMMAKLMGMSAKERREALSNVGLTDKQQMDLTAQVDAPGEVKGGALAQYLEESSNAQFEAEAKIYLTAELMKKFLSEAQGKDFMKTEASRIWKAQVFSKVNDMLKKVAPDMGLTEREALATKESEHNPFTFDQLMKLMDSK